MKCSSIKLLKRSDHHKHKKKLDQQREESLTSGFFIAEENHSYSFPWIRRGDITREPNLKITNLHLPETAKSFNTGSSLEKWSKKRPRLRSSKSGGVCSNEDDKDFCYETLETDLETLLLNEYDEGFMDNASNDDSLSNLQYEVHTDIEQLLLRTRENEEVSLPTKRRRRKNKKSKLKNRNIKFSISRAPSPRTEQIIRVDVVATCERPCDEEANVKLRRKEIIDDEEGVEKAEVCDEDFVVKCRQLALQHRKKMF